MIDVAEDREKFKELLETLSLRQPENSIINDFNAVESEAEKLDFLWLLDRLTFWVVEQWQ